MGVIHLGARYMTQKLAIFHSSQSTANSKLHNISFKADARTRAS